MVKVSSAILGFPRFGPNRELKFLVEAFWAGKVTEEALLEGAKNLRKNHWQIQKDAGLTYIPSNDFSLYDHVLDAAVTYGAVPARYQVISGLTQYFAMARGIQQKTETSSVDLPSLPMSKYFDTNYHYVPTSLAPTTAPAAAAAAHSKPVKEFLEAKALGITTRPVLVGPVTFIELARWDLLPGVVKAFADTLDEPCLVLDLSPALKTAFHTAYSTLLPTHLAAAGASNPKLVVATYFEALRENLADVFVPAILPAVDGLHVDLVRTMESIEPVAHATEVVSAVGKAAKGGFQVSLGVVDGRNVWKTDLARALSWVEQVVKAAAAYPTITEIVVSSSCSLLHSPHSVEAEKTSNADKELVEWLAFAVEKVKEIVTISTAVTAGRDAVKAELADNARSVESRRTSTRIHNPAVAARIQNITKDMLARKSPYAKRRIVQASTLNLPAFPTTTIGSFPQTATLRKLRAQHRAGSLTTENYEQLLREEIAFVIKEQEALGLDVLVHGEPERNDMVEYFGELLSGVGFTSNGWVQSYGSRGVKPPIIYGDISRPAAMTVRWTAYAQSLTKQPMKAMLTGPITLLCWSFVRDDQPRSRTAFQLALAVRDEVADLEAARVTSAVGGPDRIRVIQIDEPAIREGLPLRRRMWEEYLLWAVDAFRLSSTGVADETQIHSHMCYSSFEDIRDAIVALDCDVLSIENAKSDMKLLLAPEPASQSLIGGYPNELGPGLFDIHTNRVPPESEMAERLSAVAAAIGDPARVWVNPDCGLKTRGWKETKEALSKMVAVAKAARSA
ncbi:cobalamin-independent synthase [Zopfochytrium polystomum]|nr:cobalamin-independent synthase [Zopfochytrium polystomum]